MKRLIGFIFPSSARLLNKNSPLILIWLELSSGLLPWKISNFQPKRSILKRLAGFIIFLPLSAQAVNIIDILEGENNSQALKRELKNDIGSLLPAPYKLPLFIKAFENKNFHQALRIWEKSIAKTDFAESSTGKALYSYLLFQNQFEILSLTLMLEQSRPEKVDPIVANLWKKHAGKSHPVWEALSFRMNPKWLTVFEPEILFKTGAKSFWNLKSPTDQEYMKFLLALPLKDKIDPFSLEWSFILSLAQQEDLFSATKILAWLLSKTKEQNRRDKIHLNIARLLADIGEEAAALNYYKKVKRLSYFWLLAQEEMSWILFNKGRYREAYSASSAFLHPGLQKEISPYMFLIRSLSQLKNCDYKGFSLSLSHFKSLFSQRMGEINKMLSSGADRSLIAKLKDFHHSKRPYYELAPSHLYRSDLELSTVVSPSSGKQNSFESGSPAKKPQNSNTIGISYPLRRDLPLKNSVLLLRYMQNQKKGRVKNPSLEQKEKKLLDQLEKKIKSRLSALLKREKESILFVLQNFHIAEAELLYRTQGLPSLQPFSSQAVFAHPLSPARLFYDKNPFFIFPFRSDEIWLDELPYYQAGFVKKCPGRSYVL